MENFSMSLMLPMLFSDVFSMEALKAGFLLVPPILFMSGTTLVAGRILDRFGAWPLIPIGVLAIAFGQVSVACLGMQQSVIGIVAASAFIYSGTGLVQAPIQAVALTALRPEENPSGISIINIFIPCSAAMGPTLFIGIRSAAFGSAVSTGMDYTTAYMHGFATTVSVAAMIALVGTVVAALLAWRVSKKRP